MRLFPFLALLLLFTTACPPNRSDTVIPGVGSPTSSSVENADISPGLHEEALLLTSGGSWNYRALVPEHNSTEELPLIIALHWAGGFETYREYGACLAEPGLADLGGIVFSPEDFGQGWNPQVALERLRDFIDLAIEHWPVDPDRIILTGYSNGGIGTWLLSEFLGNRISAGIAMAGVYPTVAANYPLYVIHGTQDELFPFATAQEDIDSAIANGNSIEFITAQNLGHYEACNYLSYLQSAAEWVQLEVW